MVAKRRGPAYLVRLDLPFPNIWPESPLTFAEHIRNHRCHLFEKFFTQVKQCVNHEGQYAGTVSDAGLEVSGPTYDPDIGPRVSREGLYE
jgi:hypothetical protein